MARRASTKAKSAAVLQRELRAAQARLRLLERREREHAVQEGILGTTLENMDQGITMVDRDLRTIALNRKFLELLDFPAERFARGFNMEEAFRFNAARGEYGPGDVEAQVRERLELTRRFEPHAFERKRPDGRVIAVRGRPLPDGAGFVTTYTDVTEQRLAAERLAKSEERYALATLAATEGIYEWDLASGTLFLTEQARNFFSLPGERLTPAAWNMRVHAEDYPGYRAAILEHFKGRRPQHQHEYRLADGQGAYKWVLDRGVGVRDTNGRVVRMVGALSDITERKRTEIELRRARDEAQEALEQQTATAEILRVISRSPTETQPVFDAIVASGVKLFPDAAVAVALPEGESVVVAAIAETDPAQAEAWKRRFPFPLSAEYMHGAAILERIVVDVPDARLPHPRWGPGLRNFLASGYRAATMMPMLRGDAAIGAISVLRRQPGPLTAKQLALLRTFADQAVIAIENVRLFREIQEKGRQLEVASRHKSDFLANMSHELRTPLNAIIGFTRIVMRRSRERLEPLQYENLEKILVSGQNLLALINAILDLSKVEAGHVEVNPADLAPAAVLEHCMRTVEPLVRAEAVALVREFDGALPRMFVDEEKLRQVVINLLSNAAKFTREGTIRLRAQARAGEIDIAVFDTGIGIAADKLDRIFEEFEQADASSTREHGGTGLGLAIARRLARLMGGDIRVQSSPGSGSTFTLTLPLRYQSPA